MKTLLFATTNAGKLAELRALLPDADVKSLADFPDVPEPIEDAATFEGNAAKKAVEYARATGLPALADDSGLCVDALGGRPGVLSARYAEGPDSARIAKLLAELRDIPPDQRGAAFVCALCLAFPDRSVAIERGECRGRIGDAPIGTNGFGYDPIFVLSDGRTMAQLTREEKSAISHRGRAFAKMRTLLERLLRT